MDKRIENLVSVLTDVDLDDVSAKARETTVGKRLTAGLASILPLPIRPGTGIDGSERSPDAARRLRDSHGTLDVAIEYKLYRKRKSAAGEMDRALGQCIAYAECYDAVLFFVVYMGPPEHAIPSHWIGRSTPLRVGHKSPGVPVYFSVRPRSAKDAWSRKLKP